jgi:colicin import membrane protein
MARRERSLTKGRWRAIALSVLLHGGIVAAAVYGWFTWKHRAPPSATMAIEATVVDERTLKGIAPPPTPKPPEPEPEPVPEPAPDPVEEQGPPKPDPAEVERKQEEERLAREKLEQEKLEQQKREQEKQEAEKKEQERLDAEKRAEAEKQAAAKAAADKAAAEKAAAEKKAAEKKKADEAAAAKKAADERARLAREAELRRSMEAEERGNALRSSPEANRWIASISAKIARAWSRPPTARPGTSCLVTVRQVLGPQGGEVTAVRVISCNPDDVALRESVERAVYNASPLPPPPDPALFQPTLDITFAPE